MSTFLNYFTSVRNIQKIFQRLFSPQSTQSPFAKLALLYCVKPYIQHVQNRTFSIPSPPPISLQFCPSHPYGLYLRAPLTSFYIQSPFSSKFSCIFFLPSASHCHHPKLLFYCRLPRLLNSLLPSSITPLFTLVSKLKGSSRHTGF